MAAGEALWRRIETALDEAAGPASEPSLPATGAPSGAFRDLWQSLAFWRVAGMAGAFASLMLALGLALLATRAPLNPVAVAVLLTDDNRPAAILNAFADGQAELIRWRACRSRRAVRSNFGRSPMGPPLHRSRSEC